MTNSPHYTLMIKWTMYVLLNNNTDEIERIYKSYYFQTYTFGYVGIDARWYLKVSLNRFLPSRKSQ